MWSCGTPNENVVVPSPSPKGSINKPILSTGSRKSQKESTNPTGPSGSELKIIPLINAYESSPVIFQAINENPKLAKEVDSVSI